MTGHGMKGYLKSSNGIYVLKAKTTSIGQLEESDLCLQTGGIEDRQALIELSHSENCFVLQDLNSSSGTFVNDCRIQNAAVRLAPGDVLRFGFGADTYELVVETVPPVFCPPVSQRSVWPGHLQLIEDPKPYSPPAAASQLPVLPAQNSTGASNGWIQGGSTTVPHPPLRNRAASAGSRRVTASRPADISSSPPTVRRGAWTNTPGRSVGNGVPLSTSQTLELLLQEKDQRMLRMGDEISRLSVFESESKRKDTIIANLRDEIAALKHQLTQMSPSQNDLEITQQLLTLGCDIDAKKEEIETLKDQITKFQKGSSEVMRHSLTERDLEIVKLKNETVKLKKDNNIITGLVTSLQRDITAKEHQLLRVDAEVEKQRKEIREKDGQLTAMSAKFSRMRETKNHQEELVTKEKELVTHRHNVKQLESRLKELESEIKQLRSEQEDMKTSVAEERRAQEQLQDELERTRLLLQEMGRRERLVRVDLEQAQARVIEQMKQIIDERAQFKEKIQRLQDELDLKDLEQEERRTNAEGLRKALEESKARLQTGFGSSVKKEIETLQELSVDQSLLWVQKATTGILSSMLSWQQQSEQSLLDAGIDTSSCEGGITGCFQLLQEKLHMAEKQIKALQEQMDRVQNSWDCERQEQLNELREECEQQMAEEVRRSQTEVREQHRQQLAEAVALEKERGTEAVEEEKRRREETELRLKERSESAKVKCQEAEALKLQLNNTSQVLEEARKVEVGLREELAAQKSRQKAETEGLGDQIELERSRYLNELAEFKEQIRQHSRTIVALEERLLTVTKQQQVAEEERRVLSGKLRDAKKELEKRERNRTVRQPVQSPPPAMAPITPDTHVQEQTCALLQELAETRKQVLAQQDVILGLRRDLAGANARMSDLAGELSEKQKLELEQHRALVRTQTLELNTLRQQLAKMSQLVDVKNEEFRSSNAELRNYKEKLEQQKAARKEKVMQCEKLQEELSERDSQQHQLSVHSEDTEHHVAQSCRDQTET